MTYDLCYLTIGPLAHKGYDSIAHEAKPNRPLRATGLIVLVSPNYSVRKGNNKVSIYLELTKTKLHT